MLALEFVGAAARSLFEDVCCSIGDAVRRLPCGKTGRVIIPRAERWLRIKRCLLRFSDYCGSPTRRKRSMNRGSERSQNGVRRCPLNIGSTANNSFNSFPKGRTRINCAHSSDEYESPIRGPVSPSTAVKCYPCREVP